MNKTLVAALEKLPSNINCERSSACPIDLIFIFHPFTNLDLITKELFSLHIEIQIAINPISY